MKVFENLERIFYYQHQHLFFLHISELFSQFHFIISQTNKNNF